MSLAVVVGLLSGATGVVGLSVETVHGLDEEDESAIARGLALALEDLTGSTTVLDRAPADCGQSVRCIAETQARAGAGEVVFLKLYGAATMIRIVAERAGEAAGTPAAIVQIDLPRSRVEWQPRFAGVALILFPSLPPERSTAPPVAPTEPHDLLGWTGVGAGVVSAGIATALRLASNAGRARIESTQMTAAELERARDAAILEGTASNVLFGLAAVTLTAGVMWLLGAAP